MVLVVAWTTTSLSAIFLGLRVHVRFSRCHGLWWDDHILIVSWVLTLMSAISTTIWVSYGYGMQAQDIKPENMPALILLGNIVPAFALIASSLSKTSFAITLLRFSKTWMKKSLWFVIVSMNLIIGMAVLFFFISCTPVSKTWHTELDGTCWDQKSLEIYTIFASGYSAAMDFVLSLLPLILLWNVQIQMKEKIGVIVAMSMGIFVGVVTVIKSAYIPQGYASNYVTDKGESITVWTLVEPTVTIMAASIPVLRVFLKEHTPTITRFYGPGTRKVNHCSTDRHGTTVTVGVGQGQTHIDQRPDDCSDRGILHRQNIIQSSEVSIEYTSRNETDNISYEMERMD